MDTARRRSKDRWTPTKRHLASLETKKHAIIQELVDVSPASRGIEAACSEFQRITKSPTAKKGKARVGVKVGAQFKKRLPFANMSPQRLSLTSRASRTHVLEHPPGLRAQSEIVT